MPAAARTIQYGYAETGWKDLMTSYSGQAITYDAIGNPLTYRDGMTMTWTGRQLTTLTQNGETVSYKYDTDGLRLEKTANGITTEYQYVNGQLLGEKRSTGVVLRYTYDPLGALSSIQYTNGGGTWHNYYVRCTLSGDVDQIYSGSGNLVARYVYDTWGNTVSITDANGNAITSSTHIANINSIRYRGYYWDRETGLYYLQSRYYDPETGRYVNPDGYVFTGQDMQSGNMYAYCGNNPVTRSDPYGGMYVIDGGDGSGIHGKSQSDWDRWSQKIEARKKYNKTTINIYYGDGSPDSSKLNVHFYDAGQYVNINIDKSLSVQSSIEMDAVLDVIMASEYYSYEKYGSKGFMRAQWLAHNCAYSMASSGGIAETIASILSGSDNPKESAQILDIRERDNMLLRQKLVYAGLSWVGSE